MKAAAFKFKYEEKPMSDPLDNFEIEEPEASGPADDLWPEDKENLEKAMNDCIEIFNAPAQANVEKAFEAIEVLEEVQPSFSDVQISDQIGEAIELLHEVCDEALSSKDAEEGKRLIQKLAEAFKIHLSGLD